jgi:hypothetical protein
MEFSRCKVTAKKMSDHRCKNQRTGVVIVMEDFRCKNLSNQNVLEIEDSRCYKIGVKTEDPRCQNLRNW